MKHVAYDYEKQVWVEDERRALELKIEQTQQPLDSLTGPRALEYAKFVGIAQDKIPLAVAQYRQKLEGLKLDLAGMPKDKWQTIAGKLEYASAKINLIPAFGDGIGSNVNKAELALAAKYIEQAAKSHADLLAALKGSVKSLQFALQVMPDIPVNSEFRQSLNESIAAIAQAEGKK